MRLHPAAGLIIILFVASVTFYYFSQPQDVYKSPPECVDSGDLCSGGVCWNGDCVQLSEDQLEVIQRADMSRWIVQLKDKPLSAYKKELESTQRLPAASVASSLQDYKNQMEAKQAGVINNLKAKGFDVRGEYKNVFNGIIIEGSDIQEVLDMPEVEAVYPDTEVHAFLDVSVPEIKADQVWNLLNLSGVNVTGEGMTIAILDTGVNYTHPDLGGCFGAGCKVIGGWDFHNGDADPMDDHYHGTHCAAIAAGNGVLKGVAPDAKIYAYKVLSNSGSGSLSTVVLAIERAIDPNDDGDFSDHVDVISMSLGASGFPDDPISQASDNAADLGVAVVAAVGNTGQDGYFTVGSPGNARKVIGVGASCTTQDVENDIYGVCPTNITTFSSRGPTPIGTVKPDIVAPGHNICAARHDNVNPVGSLPYSTCLDDMHIWLSGTSMATPHVAGAAALIKQMHPEWTTQEVKNVLKGTARDTGEGPLVQGAGIVDVLIAVETANPYPTAMLDDLGLFVHSIVVINGTAYSENFENYTLEYGEGIDPVSWNLVNFSTIPIQDADLGYLDVSSIAAEEFTIRLTVYDTFHQMSRDWVVGLKSNETWKSGWPQQIDTDGMYIEHAPVYGDLDGDGSIEIIAGSPGLTGARVFVWDADGNIRPGWPQEVLWGGASTPALGDVDGDGDLEIVYKSTSFIDPTGGGTRIYVWNDDGTTLNSNWPKDLINSIITLDSPTVEDIDNDGKDEIINSYSTFENVKIFNEDGSEVAGGWTSVKGDDIGASVADLDNDGNKEIIVVTPSLSGEPYKLQVWDNSGSSIPNFPVSFPGITDFSPVIIGDINDDIEKEMIFVTRSNSNCYLNVYDRNGNSVNGWPVSFTCYQYYTYIPQPMLLDIDGDHRLEIAVSTKRNSGVYVDVFDGNGNFINGRKIKDGSIWITENPVSYKTQDDVIILETTENAEISHVLTSDYTGWTQNIIPQQILENLLLRPPENGMSLGDIDNDGSLELVTIIYSGNFMYNDDPRNVGTRVFVIELEESGDVVWPTYKFDVKHTGNFYLPNQPPTVVLNLPDTYITDYNIGIFNCSVYDNSMVLNMSLYTTTGGWGMNYAELVNSPEGDIFFPIEGLADGDYVWNCLSYDEEYNTDWADNHTFIVDTTPPISELVSPADYSAVLDSALFECAGHDSTLYNISLFGSWDGWGIKDIVTDLMVDNYTANFFITTDSGTYEWNCYVCDAVGLCAFAPQNRTITFDTTPPATVSVLVNSSQMETWIYWAWSNPPEPDLSHVEVWIDGEFKENISSPDNFYNATGFTPGSMHTISTKTADALGNINNNWVNHTSTTIGQDDSPPDIVFDNSTTGNQSNTSNDWLFVNVTGNETLRSCFLELNGTNYTMTVNDTYCYLNYTITADGVYSYVVYAFDLWNNMGMTFLMQLTVDTTPPSITNEVVDKIPYEYEDVIFSANITDALSSLSYAYLEFNRTINYSILSISIQTNFSILVTSDNYTAHDEVYWRIYAEDSLGNLGMSPEHMFVVRNQVPDIVLMSPTNSSVLTTQDVTLLWESIDLDLEDVISYGLYVNGSLVTEAGDQNFTIPVSDGMHNWSVNASDGFDDNMSETWHFSISIPNASVNITSPEEGEWINTTNVTVQYFKYGKLDNILPQVTLQLDNESEVYDIDGDGEYLFENVSEGQHVIHVWLVNMSGGKQAYDNVTFHLDVTPPVISGVSATTAVTSATVTWTTDEIATTTVFHGTDQNLTGNVSYALLNINHQAQLTGLLSNTQYYYNVTSCDAAYNCNTLGPYTLLTQPVPVASGGDDSGDGSGGSSPPSNIPVSAPEVIEETSEIEFLDPALLRDNSGLRETSGDALGGVLTDEAVEEIIKITESILPDFEGTRELYVADGKTTITTRIKYIGEEVITNLVVYESIPKELAENESDINISSSGFKYVVNPDPEFMFVYPQFAAGEQQLITYKTLGNANMFTLEELHTMVYGEKLNHPDCNNNGACEADIGEDRVNCPADCDLPICEQGEMRCSGNNLETCDGSGWQVSQICDYGCDQDLLACREIPIPDTSAYYYIVIIVVIVMVGGLLGGFFLRKKKPKTSPENKEDTSETFISLLNN